MVIMAHEGGAKCGAKAVGQCPNLYRSLPLAEEADDAKALLHRHQLGNLDYVAENDDWFQNRRLTWVLVTGELFSL